MKITLVIFYICFSLILYSQNMSIPLQQSQVHSETIVLGGGCFWCIEAVFESVKGVLSVSSGYSGGTVKNPSYEAVCSGNTGHAEVCKVDYDATVVSCEELLELFFSAHDPTTLNRQGNDIGTQYRSVIFYTTEHQAISARAYITTLSATGLLAKPICTQVLPLSIFYKAEPYHQNYYMQNTSQGYCQMVISPKLKAVKLKYPQRFKQ